MSKRILRRIQAFQVTYFLHKSTRTKYDVNSRLLVSQPFLSRSSPYPQKQTRMEVFFTFFNVIQALYALAFTAGSVYVFYTDGTLISKVALGLSAFYLATAFMGLAGRMYKCGNGLYIILLLVLLLVQAAFFVAFTFYSDDVLGWLREVDEKAVTETVDKAWDTINSHKSVVKISLGVDVGFIAAALALSVFSVTRRSPPMYLETSPV